jgi:glutamate N-acetyltransferase/amino-acid N-acetyltransferase
VSVTAARGFAASGIVAGLKASGRPDLGLLVCETDAAAAGLFTTNAFPAAPVALSQEHLLSGTARAVIVNSGQANAGTGEWGVEDARATAAAAAEAIGARPRDVLVCSTGVIGPRVKMTELTSAVPAASQQLDGAGGSAFARAILTTDSKAKETEIHTEGFTVGGCAKGAGMIAPDLATLLAFLTTDAVVEPGVLDAVIRRAVAPAFNGLTVDGCTSTNDTVLVLASGASGVRAVPGSRALPALEGALAEAARDLARQVVLDAEGSTKAIAVQVRGAQDDAAAQIMATAVAGSLLVKTAVFGADPNAGRLLQAVGAAGIPVLPHVVSIALAGHTVVQGGAMVPFDTEACREALKERDVVIHVDLGVGDGEATSFGCDLGYEYVRINAEYTT